MLWVDAFVNTPSTHIVRGELQAEPSPLPVVLCDECEKPQQQKA